jgi:hypothetical protein
MGSRLLECVAAALLAATLWSTSSSAQSTPAAGDNVPADLLAIGDYPAAIAALRQRADDGDALAQMTLADLYLGGYGAERNIHLAIAWLEQAALGGNAHAMVRLGTLYKDMGPVIGGGRMQETWPQAAGWFIMAADAGSAEGAYQAGALFNIGQVSDYSELLSEDAEELLASRFLERASAMGHAQADLRLALNDRDAPDHIDRLRTAAGGLHGLQIQAMLANSSSLEDRMPPEERYFWGLVALHTVALTRNDRMLIGASPDELAADMEDLAGTLDPADRAETEARAADFVADWDDPYP